MQDSMPGERPKITQEDFRTLVAEHLGSIPMAILLTDAELATDPEGHVDPTQLNKITTLLTVATRMASSPSAKERFENLRGALTNSNLDTDIS